MPGHRVISCQQQCWSVKLTHANGGSAFVQHPAVGSPVGGSELYVFCAHQWFFLRRNYSVWWPRTWCLSIYHTTLSAEDAMTQDFWTGWVPQPRSLQWDKSRQLMLETGHPRPLSYERQLKGCTHFGKANAELKGNRREEIKWNITTLTIGWCHDSASLSPTRPQQLTLPPHLHTLCADFF